MEEILWHRRESRRKTEKTNIFLQPWEAPAYSKSWGHRVEDRIRWQRTDDRSKTTVISYWLKGDDGRPLEGVK
jgi:hypothetical protein